MHSEIVDVKPLHDFKLLVNLANGSALVVDLQKKISSLRFGILRDPSVWQSVSTNGASIRWQEHVGITLGEALEITVEE